MNAQYKLSFGLLAIMWKIDLIIFLLLMLPLYGICSLSHYIMQLFVPQRYKSSIDNLSK